MIGWYIATYILLGVFITLTVHKLRMEESNDTNADALTAISMFWPIMIPDLMFRLVVGRWFTGRR
jgi:hypothetical protein